MQHRGVVPAAKLTADFLKRRAGELPRDVHRDLSRKHVGTAMAAHREYRVAHFTQVEAFAYVLADELDRCG
jgi:hypothetical protein